MLEKSRGLVLKVTPFSETSVVVQLFTERFGVIPCLIRGCKKPGAKIPSNILQPLYPLSLVLSYKANSNFQQLREARQEPVLKQIPYDPLKSAMVLFLNEVLYKAIKNQAPDLSLFEYVFHGIIFLDACEGSLSSFHLIFLLKITQFLGFSPNNDHSQSATYFDLQSGRFHKAPPPHLDYLDPSLTSLWQQLLNTRLDESIPYTPLVRKTLLDKILTYFQLHIPNFGPIKSHEVLYSVMS